MSMRASILNCHGVDDMARTAAEAIVDAARQAVDDRGRFVVALSGGNTPRPLYRLLASAAYRDRIPWALAHVCFGDERMVGPDDARSNYGMALRELLAQLPVPLSQVHRIRGEADPRAEAARYHQELRSIFPDSAVRFDLLLLGMGEDGHTASLFPDSPALLEHGALACAVDVPLPGVARITLTLPCLNAARRALFLVTGSRKADLVRRIAREGERTSALPASLLRLAQGELLWIVDGEDAEDAEDAA